MTDLEILCGRKSTALVHFETGPSKAPAYVSGLVNALGLDGDRFVLYMF
jgi:hypothetical protein